MKVKCDECNAEFEFKFPQSREINDKVTEIYFVCPECGAEYHSFYRTPEVDKLMWQNRCLTDRTLIRKNKEKIEKIQREIGDEFA
jgi:rubredoxin